MPKSMWSLDSLYHQSANSLDSDKAQGFVGPHRDQPDFKDYQGTTLNQHKPSILYFKTLEQSLVDTSSGYLILTDPNLPLSHSPPLT